MPKQSTGSHTSVNVSLQPGILSKKLQKDAFRDIDRLDAVTVIGHHGKSASTAQVVKQDRRYQVSRESSSVAKGKRRPLDGLLQRALGLIMRHDMPQGKGDSDTTHHSSCKARIVCQTQPFDGSGSR